MAERAMAVVISRRGGENEVARWAEPLWALLLLLMAVMRTMVLLTHTPARRAVARDARERITDAPFARTQQLTRVLILLPICRRSRGRGVEVA